VVKVENQKIENCISALTGGFWPLSVFMWTSRCGSAGSQ